MLSKRNFAQSNYTLKQNERAYEIRWNGQTFSGGDLETFEKKVRPSFWPTIAKLIRNLGWLNNYSNWRHFIIQNWGQLLKTGALRHLSADLTLLRIRIIRRAGRIISLSLSFGLTIQLFARRRESSSWSKRQSPQSEMRFSCESSKRADTRGKL